MKAATLSDESVSRERMAKAEHDTPVQFIWIYFCRLFSRSVEKQQYHGSGN